MCVVAPFAHLVQHFTGMTDMLTIMAMDTAMDTRPFMVTLSAFSLSENLMVKMGKTDIPLGGLNHNHRGHIGKRGGCHKENRR